MNRAEIPTSLSADNYSSLLHVALSSLVPAAPLKLPLSHNNHLHLERESFHPPLPIKLNGGTSKVTCCSPCFSHHWRIFIVIAGNWMLSARTYSAAGRNIIILLPRRPTTWYYIMVWCILEQMSLNCPGNVWEWDCMVHLKDWYWRKDAIIMCLLNREHWWSCTEL